MSTKPPATLSSVDKKIDQVQTAIGDVLRDLDRILAILRRRRKKTAARKET